VPTFSASLTRQDSFSLSDFANSDVMQLRIECLTPILFRHPCAFRYSSASALEFPSVGILK
jgi:hypothetical protein